jgi:hypothetical protein
MPELHAMGIGGSAGKTSNMDKKQAVDIHKEAGCVGQCFPVRFVEFSLAGDL